MIIIGILASIALPNLFSNVTKSRAAEALVNIGSMRPVVEACIAGHYATEGTCTIAFMYQTAPVSTNFTYAFTTAPANGGTGYAIAATGTNAAAGGTVTTTRAAAADGAALGAVTNACTGNLIGAC